MTESADRPEAMTPQGVPPSTAPTPASQPALVLQPAPVPQPTSAAQPAAATEPALPTRMSAHAPRRRGVVSMIIGAVLLFIIAPAVLVLGWVWSAASAVTTTETLAQGATLVVDATGTASVVSLNELAHPDECALVSGSTSVPLIKQGAGVFVGANIESGSYSLECGPADQAENFSFISVNAAQGVLSGMVTLGVSILLGLMGMVLLVLGFVRWNASRKA